MNKIANIIEIAEDLGWEVIVDKNQFTFSQFSPAGHDFNIEVEGKNSDEILKALENHFDNFDCSTEAYMWLDNTGHGKNGAPYEMIDVYKDMRSCKNMIGELYDEIEHYFDLVANETESYEGQWTCRKK